jgi:hypothetical protein
MRCEWTNIVSEYIWSGLYIYTHVPRPRNSWENMFLLFSQELRLDWWFLVSTYDIELWPKKKMKMFSRVIACILIISLARGIRILACPSPISWLARKKKKGISWLTINFLLSVFWIIMERILRAFEMLMQI